MLAFTVAPNILQQHVGEDHQPHKRKGKALIPKGLSSDFNEQFIPLSEQGHQLGGKEIAQHCQRREHRRRQLDTEPEGFFHSVVQPCPIVKAADRLKSLSKTQQSGTGKIGDAGDDGKSGNGRIPINAYRLVQADGGKTGQALPAKGGQASPLESPGTGQGRGKNGGGSSSGCLLFRSPTAAE